MKLNQIEQILAMEKYQLDQKKTETINEEPSFFTAKLRTELDLTNYLQKNFDLSLYNKVDAITNSV